jgi:hypothetical protein
MGCTVCGNTGKCSACKGTGKVKCHACKGTGLTQTAHDPRGDMGPKQCNLCHGSRTLKCSICKGMGWCPACDGRGTFR